MDQHEELAERMASLEARVTALESEGTSQRAAASRDRHPDADTGESVRVQVTNKRYDSGDYQDHIWFDCLFTAVGITRPTRAVKGTLEFCDLFGEPHFVIGYTITDRLEPGRSFAAKGVGFEYNQFISEHQWMLGTRIEDMTTRFRVQQILYEDGTTDTV